MRKMMNRSIKILISSVLILLLIPLSVTGQEANASKTVETNLKSAARQIMDRAVTCTLITLDKQGRPRARVMDPFKPEEDFTIWLGTNPKSRKVKHIKNDSRVTLCYVDKSNPGYVTIYGKAQLVDDQLEKDRRFKEAWETFYPDNKESFLLIRVNPEWMEVVSETQGIVGDPDTWTPQKVYFK